MLANFDRRLVFASGNQGKANEIRHKLKPLGISVCLPREVGTYSAELLDVAETGLSFLENALLKARAIARLTGLPTLADDSGLTVDYLNQQPGIHSARFSGDNATDLSNNQLLLEKLADISQDKRGASFHCVLVFIRTPDDPLPIISYGSWRGEILPAPRGNSGFGYDPLFYVPELDCTAGQLPLDIKNQVSHRALALNKLIADPLFLNSWIKI